MFELLATPAYTRWFQDLDEDDAAAVATAQGLLEQRGSELGWPRACRALTALWAAVARDHTSVKLERSAYEYLDHVRQVAPRRDPDIWMLHVSSERGLRVFYAFLNSCQVLLLCGADQPEREDFFDRHIPIAEREWARHTGQAGR